MTLKKLSRAAIFEAYEVSYSLTDALLAVMAAKGLTRSAIARELDVSRSEAIAANPQRLEAGRG